VCAADECHQHGEPRIVAEGPLSCFGAVPLDAGDNGEIALQSRPYENGIQIILLRAKVKSPGIVAIAMVCATLLGASQAEVISAQSKIDGLKGRRFQADSSVLFTSGEINSWVNAQAKMIAPTAVSDLHLALDNGRVIGTAQIDFLKLKQAATGQAPGWLANYLLSGKRPVSVTVRFQSSHRRGRFDVERVEIAGLPVSGAPLDFLIQNYLLPQFPRAKIDAWFDLDWRIERITVSPPGALVYVGRY
jgi:hypothetical protein